MTNVRHVIIIYLLYYVCFYWLMVLWNVEILWNTTLCIDIHSKSISIIHNCKKNELPMWRLNPTSWWGHNPTSRHNPNYTSPLLCLYRLSWPFPPSHYSLALPSSLAPSTRSGEENQGGGGVGQGEFRSSGPCSKVNLPETCIFVFTDVPPFLAGVPKRWT